MAEFWEEAFKDKQEMWGTEPAYAALVTKDFFVEKGVKKVLIPGIGYGRNAQVFSQAGMEITGIEISETAINLIRKYYLQQWVVHQGSVADMPFDDFKYDGIFCYALIHLLDKDERVKFIADCYGQLEENGYMVFTTITRQSQTYGQGTRIGKHRFEMFGGVKMFFYDLETVQAEFGNYGLIEVIEVQENYPFYLIKCQKPKQED